MQIGKYSTVGEAVTSIYYEKGIINGFYAGYSSMVMRDIPFAMI